MKNGFLKTVGLSVMLGAAGHAADTNAAGGHIENIEFKDGGTRVTQRYVDCDEAFYKFRGDPQNRLFMTCDGYEAADIPIGPDKANPDRRDNICNFTDGIDPQNPISVNDPTASQLAKRFQEAELQAYVHASTQHGNSIAQAIVMRAKKGVDVFKIYDFAIRPARAGEQRDGRVPTPNGVQDFVLQPGWTREMLIESSYVRAIQMCMDKMGLR